MKVDVVISFSWGVSTGLTETILDELLPSGRPAGFHASSAHGASCGGRSRRIGFRSRRGAAGRVGALEDRCPWWLSGNPPKCSLGHRTVATSSTLAGTVPGWPRDAGASWGRPASTSGAVAPKSALPTLSNLAMSSVWEFACRRRRH